MFSGLKLYLWANTESAEWYKRRIFLCNNTVSKENWRYYVNNDASLTLHNKTSDNIIDYLFATKPRINATSNVRNSIVNPYVKGYRNRSCEPFRPGGAVLVRVSKRALQVDYTGILRGLQVHLRKSAIRFQVST